MAISTRFRYNMSAGEGFMLKSEFFPQYNKGEDPRYGDSVYIKPSYHDRLWFKYKHDKGFRKRMNEYIKHGKIIDNRIVSLIKAVVTHGEFFNFEMIGMPGSGKSMMVRNYVIPLYAMIVRRNFIIHCDVDDLGNDYFFNMGKYLKDNFGWEIEEFDDNEPFDVYVTYSNSQTNDVITKNFKPGDVVFQDESPKQHGTGSQTSADNLDNILLVSARKLNINFAFISPKLIPMETIDYYVQVLGYIENKRLTVVMVQTSQDEYVGVMEIPLFECEDLDEYYERVSAEKKTKLKEAAGMSIVDPDAEKMKELVKKLVGLVEKQARADNVPKIMKEYVEAIADMDTELKTHIKRAAIIALARAKLSGKSMREIKGKARASKDDFMKDVVLPEEALPGGRKEKEGTLHAGTKSGFHVTMAMIEELLPKYRRDGFSEDACLQQAGYALQVLHGATTDQVAVDNELAQSTVARQVRWVIHWLQTHVGRWYEAHLAESFRKTPEIKEVVHDGGPGKPDIVLYYHEDRIEVVSAKYRKPSPARPSFTMPQEDLMPEIITCRKLAHQYPDHVVSLLNYLYNDTLKEEIVDIINWKRPSPRYTYPNR